jgi:2-dehydropantoate 2-reductase
MRIAIVGIGGVGGYYGGKLARYYNPQRDMEVIFIARGEHMAQIQKHGLKLLTTEGDLTATPAIVTDTPKNLGPMDLVIICVKTYGLEQCMRMLEKNIEEETVLLPLLNGVNNAERIKTFFPQSKTLNGCVYISSHIVSPGVVQQVSGSCQLFFGPDHDDIEAFMGLERTLTNAGIKAQLKPNIDEVVWEKYIFISPLAGVTTLFGESFGAIMNRKESRDLTEELIKEVEQIARMKGIGLSGDIVDATLAKVSAFPYETKSSMQVDCEKGNKTEIEAFTGFIVRCGEELGVNIPLHRMVYDKLKERCP